LVNKATKKEKEFEAMRGQVFDLEKQLLADRREFNEAEEKIQKHEKELGDVKDKMKVKSALAKERIQLVEVVGKTGNQ
jgi:peptidoglycan hydrolase CwlO-like protein